MILNQQISHMKVSIVVQKYSVKDLKIFIMTLWLKKHKIICSFLILICIIFT